MHFKSQAKNFLRISLTLTAFLLFLPSICSAGQFKVTRVHDGDTIKAEGYDIQITARLVGIDAPELSKGKGQPGQPFSQKAKEYLASLVLNKTVEIKGYGVDSYNRILGVIHLGGKTVNLQMVKAGLAEAYRGKPPKGFNLQPYREAEKEARDAARGMWSLRDKYMSPRDWRYAERKKYIE